jgi:hypothetical protein
MARARAARASAGQTRVERSERPGELALDVLAHLEQNGEYRALLDPGTPQQLVDLRWAALRAGRQLGRTVKVMTTQAVDSDNAPISAQVRFAAAHGQAIPSQRLPE